MESGLLSQLIKGLEFERLSEARTLHLRAKVPTPLRALNAILGGGLPLGIMMEVYGEPSAGKSTFSYITLGKFQQNYPQGVGVIVDTEASVDVQRMAYLGVDSSKILRLPASTLEVGFEQILKLLKKKISIAEAKDLPVFLLWDTIGVAPTNSQFEREDAYGGGMAERARLIKAYLSDLLPLLEMQPMLVVLLNQVITEIGGYRPSVTSGGGFGLKHDIHLKLRFSCGQTFYNDQGLIIAKTGVLNIEKSKLGPTVNGIEFLMDMRRGGVIDEFHSLIVYLKKLGILAVNGSWHKFVAELLPQPIPDHLAEYIDKSWHLNDLTETLRGNEKLTAYFDLAIAKYMADLYSYIGDVGAQYRETLCEIIYGKQDQAQDGEEKEVKEEKAC